MLLLPVPLVVALVLLFLLVRALARREGHALVLALIAACAAQSAVVALVQHYGVAALRPVQPVTAAAIAALAWLAFVGATQRPLSLRRDAVHGLAPLAALACLLVAPIALDAAIAAAFAGYGLAILRHTAGEGASLPRARLEAGEMPRLVWQGIGATLLASAAGDLLIAADQAWLDGAWRGPIVSLLSSAILLMIGLLALSPSLEPPRAHADAAAGAPEAAGSPAHDAARDAALIADLDRLMTEARLYLDPDLTLTRLARRLGVPAKALSAAINRAHGENVSRFVNRRRIAHAKRLLAEGRGVTQAMLESGFNTKSNFNREFLRLTGASPTDWLARRAGSEGERG